ncbi:hypothetical protein [Zavarzinella formosa]|uniref:hypothetical protein n=1 Tax=Zavarzinella formosa TaxID=360055 RepID=UPI0002E76597|nr:hypothetical protein [Zavarzinella formosa]
MRVDGYRESWQVADDNDLDAALGFRDDQGGALFWLVPDEADYPTLAIRVSGDLADICYFPQDGHPGFRVLKSVGPPEGGMTTLVYRGCDPASGEVTHNEFIVPFETAHAVAKEFFRSRQMSEAVSWFEL